MLNFLMKVGMLGEKLQIFTVNGLSKVHWEDFQSSTKPLTWYQVIYYQYILFVPLFFSRQCIGVSSHLVNIFYSRLFNNLLLTFFFIKGTTVY